MKQPLYKYWSRIKESKCLFSGFVFQTDLRLLNVSDSSSRYITRQTDAVFQRVCIHDTT